VYEQIMDERAERALNGLLPWKLKDHERVVLKLFAGNVIPRYVREKTDEGASEMWSKVPTACRPERGGGDVPEKRVQRKRWQIESMVRQVSYLLRSSKEESPTIVDFCGGSGHIGLIIAHLHPKASVRIVDINPQAILRARDRVAKAGLTNVSTWEGNLNDFPHPFSIGVALHACGGASDSVMRLCVERGAKFVCCPCCVGKLRSTRKNNVEERVASVVKRKDDDATKESGEKNQTMVKKRKRLLYARSAFFRKRLRPSEYDALATAADWGHAECAESSKGTTPGLLFRTAAKSLLEMDRQMWIRESAYDVKLMKMSPLNASPKNDILVGCPRPASRRTDDALDLCVLAPKLLVRLAGVLRERMVRVDAPDIVPVPHPPTALIRELASTEFGADAVDGIERKLDAFEASDVQTDLRFDECRGSRGRKLVHALAEIRGLVHISIGKGTKRVVVVRSNKQQEGREEV